MVDTTDPIITLMGDATITHEATTAYSDTGASWTDAVDGNGNLAAVEPWMSTPWVHTA